jgi:hypothetical protein
MDAIILECLTKEMSRGVALIRAPMKGELP